MFKYTTYINLIKNQPTSKKQNKNKSKKKKKKKNQLMIKTYLSIVKIFIT